MSWFRTNEANTSKEDGRILQLIKEMASEVNIYGAKVDKLAQDIKTLRGLVNRKLGFESQETESNKNADSFDSLRALNKQFGI